jgi:hypothetical protein
MADVTDFDGTDDEINLAIGSADMTGAYSAMVVLERDSTSWASIFGHHTTGGACRYGMLFRSDDRLCLFGSSALSSNAAIVVTPSSGWVAVGVSRPAGAGQTARLHLYNFGTDTFTHADGDTTSGNALTCAGGEIRLGQIDNSDFFNGRKAVLGEWASDIGDAGFEDRMNNFARSYWAGTSPVLLVDALDVFAEDHAGTSDRTFIAGTSQSADAPPGWDSWAGSSPEPPANLEAPVITGSGEVGQTLSCTEGVWQGTPTPTLTYAWVRSIDGDNLGLWPSDESITWEYISGATSATYELTVDEQDEYVLCVVTATNTEGADFLQSNTIGPIAGEPPPSTDDRYIWVTDEWVAVDRKMRVGGAWV